MGSRERGTGGNLAGHFFEVASEIFLEKYFDHQKSPPALHRSCGLFECPRIKLVGLLDVVLRREDGEVVFHMETTDHLRVERYDVIDMVA